MLKKEGVSIVVERKYVGTVKLLETKIDQKGKKVDSEHAYGKSPEDVIRALQIRTRNENTDDEIRLKKTDGVNYINCGIYSLKTGERYYKIDLDFAQVRTQDKESQEFINNLYNLGGKKEEIDENNEIYYYLTKTKEDIVTHPLYEYADKDKLIDPLYTDKPRMIIKSQSLDEVIGCKSVKEAIKIIEKLNKKRPENEKIQTFELKTLNESLKWVNRLGEEIKGAYTNKETYCAANGKNITRIYLDAKKIENNNEFIIDSNRFMDKYKINYFEGKREGDKRIYYVHKCDYTPRIERFRANTANLQAHSKPILQQSNIINQEQRFAPKEHAQRKINNIIK